MIPNLRKALLAAGYPTTILVLDFETYFAPDYRMGKGHMSTVEYVTGPRFEFTGVGYQLLNENGSVPANFLPGPAVAGFVRTRILDWDKITVIGQNLKFDALVLAEKFGVYPKYTLDLLDLTRAYESRGKHDLGTVSSTYGNEDKGNTKQFSGLRFSDLTDRPEKLLALRDYCLQDVKNTLELAEKFITCVHDPATVLPVADHTLKLYTKPVLRFDADGARALTADMNGAIVEAVRDTPTYKVLARQQQDGHGCVNGPEVLEKARIILSSNIAFVAELGSYTPVPMKQGKATKSNPTGLIPALAKKDDALLELQESPIPEVQQLITGRQAVKSWPLHIKKIHNMAVQSACSGGLFRVPLKFHGAHTGRFSGDELVNPQNMGGKGRGQSIDARIGKVRGLISAPDGQMLVISDSAQIQARILPWLAGQQDLVDGFARGEDVYSVAATTLFEERVWKPDDADHSPEAEVARVRRGFGKDEILGCGFGMGADKFFDKCNTNPDLRPVFESGQYDLRFIQRLIDTYRRTYKYIPAFWYKLEDCWKYSTRYGKPTECKMPYSDATLRLSHVAGTTFITLPSGRSLRYSRATVGRYDNKYWDGEKWNRIWGGVLTENVDQAIEADLLWFWILEAERVGIHIALHSHDEVVGCVPIPEAEDALVVLNRTLCKGPAWAAGIPLASEGCISKVYKK